MFKLKHGILILLCSLFIFTCGCTQAIESYSDELTLSDWRAQNGNGTEILLHFDTRSAELIISGGDEVSTAKISGACIVSNDGFVITDASMGENLCFSYSVQGDSAFISYEGQEIEFTRVASEDKAE